MKNGNLTPKQSLFVQEYLVDLNSTQAAIRAGYSQKNADKIGPELLGKTRVAAAIREDQAERSSRTQITQDQVIQGLYKEARREGEGSNHGARVSAWVSLGKHLGMFVDRKEVSGPEGKDLIPDRKGLERFTVPQLEKIILFMDTAGTFEPVESETLAKVMEAHPNEDAPTVEDGHKDAKKVKQCESLSPTPLSPADTRKAIAEAYREVIAEQNGSNTKDGTGI